MSFHVPELVRITQGRGATSYLEGANGAFLLDSPEPGWTLWVIASDGSDSRVPECLGWEHVSVHAYRGSGRSGKFRTPNWREMCRVKDTFWDAEDVVMQLHPKRSEYVNAHPYVLHLWRPRHLPIPTPHPSLVGPWETPDDASADR